ncbi:tyrosine-protein phosphatase [Microbacterium sp. bgisy207]|uniref:tyrosine-protein phosphatase n=1 Tax=Microbacterium sp. bgisy207 TaxID=3413800 RepID=UPI003EBCA130
MTSVSASDFSDLAPQGTHNFRDIGGLPLSAGGATRTGVLYRSDALSALTDRGLEQLAGSDIGVVVDFRTAMEQQMAPDRLPASRPPHVVQLGVLEGAMAGMAQRVLRSASAAGDPQAASRIIDEALAQIPPLPDLYVSMLTHGGSAFAETARTVARSEGAVLVHCTAGKDRTGVAIALILDAIGVERDAIVADYSISERNLAGPWTDRMFAMLEGMGLPRTPALDDLVAATPPSAIVTALEWVAAEHGGSADYLRSSGLTDDDVDTLRRRLT